MKYLIIIILVLFISIFIKLNNLSKLIKLNKEKKKSINTINPQFNKDFKDGSTYTWFIIQIGLYKLYAEDKLLDFNSLMKELSANVENITNNEQELKKWNEKYLNFIHNKNETL